MSAQDSTNPSCLVIVIDVHLTSYERVEMAGQPRQDILKAFQTEAGLTEAGSATYFANCKRNAAKTK